MTRPIDLMREGRKEELWQMCCGFLDLSLEQFMAIQRRLLEEQIKLLKRSELGRRVMGGAMPETVAEFREQVPLTTYADYLPELVEKREDVLPAKPAMWAHTPGRAGEYTIKSVPLSHSFLYEFERVAGGVGLIASCDSQGDFLVRQHMKTLSPVGSRYYGSGIVGYMAQQALGCDLLSLDTKETTLQGKTKAALMEALSQGLDAIGGLPSALVYFGEVFRQRKVSVDTAFLLSHPKASARLLRGLIKSKLAHRQMLPKDLWTIKVALGGGTDSALFGKRVEELWGRRPLELYAGVDGAIYATQTWDHEGMTFVPNLNFFEFIPEREWFKWQLDHSYQPKTVLLDEVKAGQNYEIVITNLHGGILTRYRIGDMVRITSLRNEKLGINIPQMVFERRADEFIIITALGYITEKILWKAIENTGIPYVDWTGRKETIDDKPTVHIYIELEDGYLAKEENVAAAIRMELRKLERVYHHNPYTIIGDLETTLDLKLVKVTLLPEGAFSSYNSQRRAVGVDTGNSTLPHINPPDEVLASLRAPRVLVEAAPVTEDERAAAR